MSGLVWFNKRILMLTTLGLLTGADDKESHSGRQRPSMGRYRSRHHILLIGSPTNSSFRSLIYTKGRIACNLARPQVTTGITYSVMESVISQIYIRTVHRPQCWLLSIKDPLQLNS